MSDRDDRLYREWGLKMGIELAQRKSKHRRGYFGAGVAILALCSVVGYLFWLEVIRGG